MTWTMMISLTARSHLILILVYILVDVVYSVVAILRSVYSVVAILGSALAWLVKDKRGDCRQQ